MPVLECTVCTFKNDDNSSNCQMCAAPLKKSPKAKDEIAKMYDQFNALETDSKKVEDPIEDTKKTEREKILQAGATEKGGKQWMEDSIWYSNSPSGKVLIGAVFDGHGGYNGLLASTTARDLLSDYFDTCKTKCEEWTIAEWKTVIFDLFSDMHNAIRERLLKDCKQSNCYRDGDIVRSRPNGDPIHGGSTATIVIQIRNKDGSYTILSANVGDSTAMLIPRKNGTPPWKFLTIDHGPESPDEWKRINDLPETDYPNKLMFVYDKISVRPKYECPLVFLPDGTKDQKYVKNPWLNGLHPTNVRYEPAVYAVTPRGVTKDSTCIAMTRALGDFYANQLGLSSVPSWQVTELESTSDFSIVLGSDGIWDCWKYTDFIEFVNDQLTDCNNMVTEASDKILTETIKRAIKNFGKKHIDDAAIVMWYQKSD